MKSERILIVDDERTMLHAVERVLAPHFTVRTATDAASTAELAAKEPFDLAILDIRLPGRDGFSIMDELRARQPGVDVVFMTGNLHELDTQLLRAIREKAFWFIQKPFERDVLLALVERCFELRRLAAKELAHVGQLEAELEHARRFQVSLSPPPESTLGGRPVHARLKPCNRLGGDLVDYQPAGTNGLALLASDVSGHGVQAAMLTGVVKSVFHDAHVDDFAPQAIVARLARALRPFDERMFVTVFVARLDTAAGQLDYVNGGHPPAILFTAGGAPRLLAATGPVVSPALESESAWTTQRVAMAPRDRLLLYTDGITEAPGPAGRFGDEQLHEWCRTTKLAGAAAIADLFARVKAFSGDRPQEDDQLLLLVEAARRS